MPTCSAADRSLHVARAAGLVRRVTTVPGRAAATKVMTERLLRGELSPRTANQTHPKKMRSGPVPTTRRRKISDFEYEP